MTIQHATSYFALTPTPTAGLNPKYLEKFLEPEMVIQHVS